jgi:hypothetical protein
MAKYLSGFIMEIEKPELPMIPKWNMQNIVITPQGHIAPKYLRGRKYFFDGQIWGWK